MVRQVILQNPIFLTDFPATKYDFKNHVIKIKYVNIMNVLTLTRGSSNVCSCSVLLFLNFQAFQNRHLCE